MNFKDYEKLEGDRKDALNKYGSALALDDLSSNEAIKTFDMFDFYLQALKKSEVAFYRDIDALFSMLDLMKKGNFGAELVSVMDCVSQQFIRDYDDFASVYQRILENYAVLCPDLETETVLKWRESQW